MRIICPSPHWDSETHLCVCVCVCVLGKNMKRQFFFLIIDDFKIQVQHANAVNVYVLFTFRNLFSSSVIDTRVWRLF